MHRTNCSVKQLPFSDLFHSYLNNFSDVRSFYNGNPFEGPSIKEHARQKPFNCNRARAAELLKTFNEPFDLHKNARQNIDRLMDQETLAIVTGQQLGIYGGPLYTVLKTISAIHLARQLQQKLGRPVIPVFWLADEDHDYDEIRSLQLPNREEVTELSLPAREQPLPPVAELNLPPELENLQHEAKQLLYETDFSTDLWQLLEDCFQPGRTFLRAFGDFLTRLFSKHGLVLAGSNHPEIKAFTKDIFKRAVQQADPIRQTLQDQSEQIEQQFHQQVTLYDSNLFYFSDEGNRLKISATDGKWSTGAGEGWSTEGLLQHIDEHPERFSPNVFLRPILQDKLLPTLGYVAGPGELAYYGQMKQLYPLFDSQMPLIFPRMTATIIEPAIDRILNELPFEFYEYQQRIEDLDSAYVERSEQTNIEEVFSSWKQKVNEIAEPHKEQVAAVDATLEGAAGKATAVYFGELDKLKGKVYRAAKKQDETQLNRIRRIKRNLFPGSGMQERTIAAIYFMNKYGLNIWDEILASLDEEESFDRHKLIYV